MRSKMILVTLAMLVWPLLGVSSNLVDVWADTTGSTKYKDLVVIAFVGDADIRDVWEEQIVEVFVRNDISMLEGNVITGKAELTSESITQILNDRGLDAVLVLRFVSAESTAIEENDIARASLYHPPSSCDNPIRDMNDVYVSVNTIYTTVGELYDLNTGKKVWSAVTETIEPNNVESMGKSIGRTILMSLNENKLLAFE